MEQSKQDKKQTTKTIHYKDKTVTYKLTQDPPPEHPAYDAVIASLILPI